MSHYCLSGEQHTDCNCSCSPCKRNTEEMLAAEYQAKLAQKRYDLLESYRIRLAEEKKISYAKINRREK